MKALYAAAGTIQAFFEKENWQFCFIGGIALQRWGEPRLTIDIDISLLTQFTNEEYYIDKIMQTLKPRIQDAKQFALKKRVILAKTDEDIGVDIALAGLPFEQHVIERSSKFEFLEGLEIRTASAEDLIVMKSFANRDKDWGDVQSILIRQTGNLDWNCITENLQPLCELKEDPGILDKLESIKMHVEAI